jgi:hypothetical protein
MPLSYAIPINSSAILSSIWFLKLTQLPKLTMLNCKPDFPKRLYSILFSLMVKLRRRIYDFGKKLTSFLPKEEMSRINQDDLLNKSNCEILLFIE